MNAQQLQALHTSFIGACATNYHTFDYAHPARIIGLETVRAYIIARGGCPCEPGTPSAWYQYHEHLTEELRATGSAPDHSTEAEYGPRGRKLNDLVGIWSTVRYALASSGLECLKPSPRKTMISTAPGKYMHAEIEWLARVSPSGERLFRLYTFCH